MLGHWGLVDNHDRQSLPFDIKYHPNQTPVKCVGLLDIFIFRSSLLSGDERWFNSTGIKFETTNMEKKGAWFKS